MTKKVDKNHLPMVHIMNVLPPKEVWHNVMKLDQAKTHNRHQHDIVEGRALNDAKYTFL